ncbi:aminoglycoside phosphotransferase APH(3') [Microbacterium sorbitolivorans]|uniref:Aminoglycoside 3'-phosphotransferase n=1 Tax=Microbacterium sorbitolivorans TaxID=1867410 RepID=A0A367Y1N8_9MICO|nr:phosphotransferase [Microbacterium sorbitolivorans]RCK59748.1 aminoglycoside 3'-phosphotransferase [Microbacterium sorbitolivorans]GGF39630.1 aminoglycoside phosphotransferase APH(3') [Microbacterium sorbitolivorans]
MDPDHVPSDLAGVPEHAEVPAIVTALDGGEHAEAVWLNGLGGLTFRIPGRHAKWQPGSAVDLADEAARLEWAAEFVAVPSVVSFIREGDEQLLVTETVPGISAVLEPWLSRPRETARALGAGLRAFHDALPVEECPWTWSVADRLARVADPSARERLVDPGVSKLVVCHGDACAPNTLLGSDGRATAHVDLGALGVADLWADLAVLAMSVTWNFGAGLENEVYAGYGIDPDPVRIAFYRELWNAE